MPELIQVRKKAQVTLPQSVRETLGIEEGDFLDVRVQDGEIVLKPKKLVDRDQTWFWTQRWQEGEKKAEEDIRSGRVRHFDNARQAVVFLRKRTRGVSTKPDRSAR